MVSEAAVMLCARRFGTLPEVARCNTRASQGACVQCRARARNAHAHRCTVCRHARNHNFGLREPDGETRDARVEVGDRVRERVAECVRVVVGVAERVCDAVRDDVRLLAVRVGVVITIARDDEDDGVACEDCVTVAADVDDCDAVAVAVTAALGDDDGVSVAAGDDVTAALEDGDGGGVADAAALEVGDVAAVGVGVGIGSDVADGVNAELGVGGGSPEHVIVADSMGSLGIGELMHAPCGKISFPSGVPLQSTAAYATTATKPPATHVITQ